jgi:hypothetical protein
MPRVLCLFCAEPQRWICDKCLHCEACCNCTEASISYIESHRGVMLRRQALNQMVSRAGTLTKPEEGKVPNA